MQGLMHYADSPSPPPTAGTSTSGPSRSRVDKIDHPAPPAKRARLLPPPAMSTSMTPQPTAPVVASNPSASSKAGGKGKSREEPITIPDDLPENLTHTAQVALPKSDLAKEPTALEEKEMEDNGFEPMYAGMTEQEVFDAVTRPDDIPGMPNWGIPPPVDTKECSPQLKAKVAQFLSLKYSKNQHINTSLLSSSTFHNPHIYSKLVEFVDLDERRSNFAGKGWLTRIGIEGELDKYGPKRMSEEQKRKQENVKRSQEAGKRSAIQFQTGRSAGAPSAVSASTAATDNASAGNTAERRRETERRDRDKVRQRQRDGDRDRERRDRHRGDRPRDGDRAGSNGKYRDTLGFGRDRDGGWDERDMKKEKPKYRYY